MSAAQPARADLIGSRVLLYADFSKLLVCKAIPGAAWDTMHRAWSYPATPQTARRIRAAFPGAQLSDTLLSLANQQAQPTSFTAPAARTATLPPTCRDLPVTRDAETPGGSVAVPLSERPEPKSKTTPWGHQRAAYWAVMDQFAREKNTGGFLLALGMGCGKSKIAIDIASNLEVTMILIICPLRVVDVWPKQVSIHAGVPIRVLPLGDDAGTVSRKTERASEAVKLSAIRNERLAVIINYESMWRDPFSKWALAQKWGLIICDESHRIKKPSGKASMFCNRLRTHSKYRLALTGTPMPHSPLDVYGQFRFLDDRVFGRSYYAFKQNYAVMGGFQQKQIVAFRNMEELEALMKKATFRVGKDVLDLPPETHVTYHCDLTADGRRAYKELERDFVTQVKEGLVTAANAMVKLLRLQQITGGAVKTEDDRYAIVDTAKRALLADTLEDIGPEEPVVVFCRFRSDLDAVHAAAADLKYTSMELSGRVDNLREWQAGGAQVLAVQISAGGVGVDLTRARYNAYYSLSFSLGEYDQSLSRVHRPGQTRPVTHIHLVARNTVDEKIIRALENRAEVIESILSQIKEQK